MIDPYIGEIDLVGFSFAPREWMICFGDTIEISDNEALFALLGTMYGGDGRTTFAVPDLRGRVSKGVGDGPGLQLVPDPGYYGNRGGHETISFGYIEEYMPSHTHTVTLSGGSISAGNNFKLKVGTEGGSASSTATTNSLLDSTINSGYREGATDTIELNNSITGIIDIAGISASASNTGGLEAFDILNPYMGLIYGISLYGRFPPRN